MWFLKIRLELLFCQWQRRCSCKESKRCHPWPVPLQISFQDKFEALHRNLRKHIWGLSRGFPLTNDLDYIDLARGNNPCHCEYFEIKGRRFKANLKLTSAMRWLESRRLFLCWLLKSLSNFRTAEENQLRLNWPWTSETLTSERERFPSNIARDRQACWWLLHLFRLLKDRERNRFLLALVFELQDSVQIHRECKTLSCCWFRSLQSRMRRIGKSWNLNN